MVFVEKITDKMADFIHSKAENPSSKKVLTWAISILINYIIFFICIICITSITGDIKEGLLASVAFPILRYFSGGLHMKSADLCNVISGTFALIAVYAPINYWYIGLIMTIIAFLILMITAPSNDKKSTIPVKFYPLVKLAALAIVSSNFLFHSTTLAVVFFMQSVTTLRIFQRILDENKL